MAIAPAQIMKDDQGNSQMQSHKLESVLGYYKESNKNIQFEMSKHIILHRLIEQENHHSKDQNRKLERANEDIKKLLSAKNEEISWLKNHNQDPKDKIKKFEDNNESPYISDNDLEEDITHLNKLIMDKDDQLAEIQKKKDKNSRIKDMSTSTTEGKTPAKVWQH